MATIIGSPVGASNSRPDWLQTDPTKSDYIRNKPNAEFERIDVGDLKSKSIDSPPSLTDRISEAIQNAFVNRPEGASRANIEFYNIPENDTDEGYYYWDNVTFISNCNYRFNNFPQDLRTNTWNLVNLKNCDFEGIIINCDNGAHLNLNGCENLQFLNCSLGTLGESPALINNCTDIYFENCAFSGDNRPLYIKDTSTSFKWLMFDNCIFTKPYEDSYKLIDASGVSNTKNLITLSNCHFDDLTKVVTNDVISGRGKIAILATESDIPTKVSAFENDANYANNTEVIASQETAVSQSAAYTDEIKSNTDQIISANKSATEAQLATKADITYVDGKVKSAVDGLLGGAVDEAYDTLLEIENLLKSGSNTSSELISKVNSNTSNIESLQAKNAAQDIAIEKSNPNDFYIDLKEALSYGSSKTDVEKAQIVTNQITSAYNSRPEGASRTNIYIYNTSGNIDPSSYVFTEYISYHSDCNYYFLNLDSQSFKAKFNGIHNCDFYGLSAKETSDNQVIFNSCTNINLFDCTFLNNGYDATPLKLIDCSNIYFENCIIGDLGNTYVFKAIEITDTSSDFRWIMFENCVIQPGTVTEYQQPVILDTSKVTNTKHIVILSNCLKSDLTNISNSDINKGAGKISISVTKEDIDQVKESLTNDITNATNEMQQSLDIVSDSIDASLWNQGVTYSVMLYVGDKQNLGSVSEPTDLETSAITALDSFIALRGPIIPLTGTDGTFHYRVILPYAAQTIDEIKGKTIVANVDGTRAIVVCQLDSNGQVISREHIIEHRDYANEGINGRVYAASRSRVLNFVGYSDKTIWPKCIEQFKKLPVSLFRVSPHVISQVQANICWEDGSSNSEGIRNHAPNFWAHIMLTRLTPNSGFLNIQGAYHDMDGTTDNFNNGYNFSLSKIGAALGINIITHRHTEEVSGTYTITPPPVRFPIVITTTTENETTMSCNNKLNNYSVGGMIKNGAALNLGFKPYGSSSSNIPGYSWQTLGPSSVGANHMISINNVYIEWD